MARIYEAMLQAAQQREVRQAEAGQDSEEEILSVPPAFTEADIRAGNGWVLAPEITVAQSNNPELEIPDPFLFELTGAPIHRAEGLPLDIPEEFMQEEE